MQFSKSETIATLLEFAMQDSRSAQEVGEKIILIAYSLRTPHAPKNTRDMGLMMGCSHAAAHKKLKPESYIRLFLSKDTKISPASWPDELVNTWSLLLQLKKLCKTQKRSKN